MYAEAARCGQGRTAHHQWHTAVLTVLDCSCYKALPKLALCASEVTYKTYAHTSKSQIAVWNMVQVTTHMLYGILHSACSVLYPGFEVHQLLMQC